MYLVHSLLRVSIVVRRFRGRLGDNSSGYEALSGLSSHALHAADLSRSQRVNGGAGFPAPEWTLAGIDSENGKMQTVGVSGGHEILSDSVH